MRDTMQELGLPPPRFTQAEKDGLCVQVILENNIAFRKQYVDERAIAIIGHNQFAGLGEKERVLINYTAEHHRITVSDAIRVVRGGWKQAKNILESMCERGLIARVSPMEIERDPKAHYVLLQQETRDGSKLDPIQLTKSTALRNSPANLDAMKTKRRLRQH